MDGPGISSSIVRDLERTLLMVMGFLGGALMLFKPMRAKLKVYMGCIGLTFTRGCMPFLLRMSERLVLRNHGS